MSDPSRLERIIDEWWDLELEEHDPSWMLSPVNSACTWSSTNDFSSPAHVLTRKGNPFHLLRPHGVLEVVWGHRQWTTAIALPSGSTITIVLVFLPRCAGPSLPRPVLYGVIILDSARSLLSVTLGLSFKYTSRLFVVRRPCAINHEERGKRPLPERDQNCKFLYSSSRFIFGTIPSRLGWKGAD